MQLVEVLKGSIRIISVRLRNYLLCVPPYHFLRYHFSASVPQCLSASVPQCL